MVMLVKVNHFIIYQKTVFQPINNLLENLANSFGNISLETSNLTNDLTNSLMSTNLVPNHLVSSNLVQNSFVANNLANCFNSNNLSTSLVSNLTIQNLQPINQTSSHLQSPTISQTSAARKRSIKFDQDQAFNLAKRNSLTSNLTLLPTSCLNSIMIDKQPTIESNQIILNNFHSTLNPAAANKSAPSSFANSILDFDNLQFNANVVNLPINGSINSFSNSIQTPNTSNLIASTVNNLQINQQQQDSIQIEPTYIDFRNHLYQAQIKDETNKKLNNTIELNSESNLDLNFNNIIVDGFILNNATKN